VQRDLVPAARNANFSAVALCGAGYQPAACFQQAIFVDRKSRPEGGCRLIARPTRTAELSMARGVQSGMAMTTGKQGDRTLDINTEPVTWENLADRLKQTLVRRPDGVFFIAGAPSLDFQDIARVLDEARGAGINRIGLMPRFK
jgi:hypothetical protein